jgi:hypothetical protein
VITYRIELLCDGCGAIFLDRPSCLPLVLQRMTVSIQQEAETCGWLTDGAMHYCPKCQRQQKAG